MRAAGAPRARRPLAALRERPPVPSSAQKVSEGDDRTDVAVAGGVPLAAAGRWCGAARASAPHGECAGPVMERGPAGWRLRKARGTARHRRPRSRSPPRAGAGWTTEVSAKRHAGAGCSHPRAGLPPLARPARTRLRASRRLRARTSIRAPRTASAVSSPSQRERQRASTAATSARASSWSCARCSRPTNDSA